MELSRRALLRGAGAAIALPWLDAMSRTSVLAATGPAAPRRMAFVFVPNGVNMSDWTPTKEGADFDLRPIMEPLAPLKNDLLVLTGLTHDKARANGDGPGDHARSGAAFLTGCQPRKTDGANIRAGISADQVAAQRIGSLTRLPSLELGTDRGMNAGNCDSGYSCAYSSNISWRSESTPMAKETNPRAVFERLFGDATAGGAEAAKRNAYRKSILDYVRDDSGKLQGSLGSSDRRKLDEYLTAVREIEQRIQRTEQQPKSVAKPTGFTPPTGIPKEYGEHIKLMLDLMVLAFQTDTTRVATFMMANEGSNRPYPFIGVREGHHDLSHHGNDAGKKEKIGKINKFHMTQFADFLKKLAAIKEGNGKLLDNCQIAYGSAISDGNRHNHDDLPVLVAGRAGGALKTGRHLRFAKDTPLNNLWLSMLDRMDARIENLGDGTGRLSNLS